jgi:hypothetical protein
MEQRGRNGFFVGRLEFRCIRYENSSPVRAACSTKSTATVPMRNLQSKIKFSADMVIFGINRASELEKWNCIFTAAELGAHGGGRPPPFLKSAETPGKTLGIYSSKSIEASWK